MTKRILLGTLVLLCALALGTPSSAVTVGGIDWVLLAKTGILMEQSDDCPHIIDPLNPPVGKVCMHIEGNVGVSDVGTANAAVGRLQIGSKNDILGLARAHNIVFGTLSETDTCNFDITSGVAPNPPVCHAKSSPAILPIVAAWPPGPLGAVPPYPAVCNPGTAITVAIGATQALAPGCYKDVRVNAGGTLNLSAGTYNFKSLRLIAGATLNGASLTTTTVNVQGLIISEAGANWNDVFLESFGSAAQSVSEFINIGNGNHLKNVVLYVPTAAIHLHLGTTGENIEAVANFITVEPVIIFPGTVSPECGCFEEVTKSGTNVLLKGGQNLDLATSFVLSATCNVAGGTTVPATAVNATTATLDASGVAAGTYKVIAVFNTGSYCNDTTVTLP